MGINYTFMKKTVFVHVAISVLFILAAGNLYFFGGKLSPKIPALTLLFTGLLIPVMVYGYARMIVRSEIHFHRLFKAQQRFKYKSDYYESILQDSTDIIFTIDKDGYILKFNKGAEANFGYSQIEIVGKSFKQVFINEADEKKLYEMLDRDGKISNMEIAMKTKNGEPIFASLSLSRMKNEIGEVIGLVATCKNITEKKILEQELIQKNKQLEELAITDSLTGLYNSRHFYEILKKELARLKRQPGEKLSLLMVDVDCFKIYNDTNGHQAGDVVLRCLGHIISSSIRVDIDSGYRYGGDEFTILLPNTHLNEALVVADRITKSYDSQKFVPTALSIGIADTDGSVDKDALVKMADQEMYKMKKHSR